MRKKVLGFFLILLLIIVPVLVLGLKKVERGEIGVKTRLFPVTGKKGIEQKALNPGLYLILPVAEKLDIFPGRIQKLELTSVPGRGDRPGNDNVDIQTSDGTTIYVDATLLYRVAPSGAPRLLSSLGHDFLRRKVRPEFIAVLKYKLGELNAEGFYNAEERESKAKEAMAEFNRRLKSNGIEAVQLLIRDFHYQPEYEKAIEDRKLADQTALLNKSRSASSKAAAEVARIQAMGKAMAKVEAARGDAEAKKIRADARLYLELKQAKADQLIQTAKAKGDALIAKAMAGPGGQRIVALEMVDVLKGLDKIVVQSGGKQGVNPLDLKSLLKLTGVEK
ncbi:MAG: prohibitin family protein [Acidobacteria bacterium]|nr:prohibitin family protein [Acidobacteriota bacterium]